MKMANKLETSALLQQEVCFVKGSQNIDII